MNWLHFIIDYLLLANVVTFIAYGIDKYKAKKGKWRISEATLLVMAFVGGSIGAWLGMKAFHHKTMHKKFYIGGRHSSYCNLRLRYGLPISVMQYNSVHKVLAICARKSTQNVLTLWNDIIGRQVISLICLF